MSLNNTMIKYVKLIVLLSLIISCANVQGNPQDINDAAILAAAQAMDVIANGAAASDKKEFEFFGANFKNQMEIGFGDAARAKRSNQLLRTKHFGDKKINSHKKIITKRAIDEYAIAADNTDDFEYSLSSSSSSQSEEN